MEPQYLSAYGILKRGFTLDLTKVPEATFVGTGEIAGANLYRIGSGVGLRFVEDPNRVVKVEVFEIKPGLWQWLDDIESNGLVYIRKQVTVKVTSAYDDLFINMTAWVYEHIYYPESWYNETRLIKDGIYKNEGRHDV